MQRFLLKLFSKRSKKTALSPSTMSANMMALLLLLCLCHGVKESHGVTLTRIYPDVRVNTTSGYQFSVEKHNRNATRDDQFGVNEGNVNATRDNQFSVNKGNVNAFSVDQGDVNATRDNQFSVNKGNVNAFSVDQGDVNATRDNQFGVNQGNVNATSLKTSVGITRANTSSVNITSDIVDTWSPESQLDNIGSEIATELTSPEDEGDTELFQTDLLMVTVLKRTEVASSAEFWVDGALVYFTVTLVTDADPRNCVLLDQYGQKHHATISTWTTRKWTIHQPSIGQWRVQQDYRGQGSGSGFNVSVQGASGLDLEVSLYRTDVNTGVAQLVHDSPTAGHEVRTIIDMMGADALSTVYNASLRTSDGQEVASDWLRPAGGPSDPQYATTFTWPSAPVYIRIIGLEQDGSFFERQTPFIIKPIPIDLLIVGKYTIGTVSPDRSLQVQYWLTNRGRSDSFVVTASLDRTVFSAEVSPAQIRLGHLGSLRGHVTVSVQPYTPATTGLLTISAWSLTHPTVVQSVTLFLNSLDDVTDRSPPICETSSVSGNCTSLDVTSSSCGGRSRHWVVRASVDDAVSGLKAVRFANAAEDEHYSIAPFSDGQANEPIAVVFVASCCSEEVLLDCTDVAGNAGRCKFLRPRLVEPTPPSPITSHYHKPVTTTTTNTTTPTTTTPSRDEPPLTTAAQRPTHLPRLTPRRPSLIMHLVSKTPLAVEGKTQKGHNEGRPTKVPATTTTTPTTPTTTGTTTTTTTTMITTVSDVVVTKTEKSNVLIDGMPAMHTVTKATGGKKHPNKGDYSTLKTVSIILGSIGGFAGLCIGAICLVFYVRFRRLRRTDRQRLNSNHSDSSSNSSSDSSSGGGGGGGSGWKNRSRVPDLLRANNGSPRQEFSTFM